MTVQPGFRPISGLSSKRVKNKAKLSNRQKENTESVGIQGFLLAAGEGFEHKKAKMSGGQRSEILTAAHDI